MAVMVGQPARLAPRAQSQPPGERVPGARGHAAHAAHDGAEPAPPVGLVWVPMPLESLREDRRQPIHENVALLVCVEELLAKPGRGGLHLL